MPLRVEKFIFTKLAKMKLLSGCIPSDLFGFQDIYIPEI